MTFLSYRLCGTMLVGDGGNWGEVVEVTAVVAVVEVVMLSNEGNHVGRSQEMVE